MPGTGQAQAPPLAHLRFDVSAYQLDPLGVQVVLELHPGRDKHAGRPELHGEDLLDAGDLGMAADRGECRGAHNRIGGFTDQQLLGVPAEDNRDIAEQDGDHQRGRAFPCLDSGYLVEHR